MKEFDDLLPEYYRYSDDGCDLFSSCLECPFPKCRYDGRQYGAKGLRDREILRLRNEEGKSITELAKKSGLCKRTIHRIIRRTFDE